MKRIKNKENINVGDVNSKLACIIYDENITSEWIGAEEGEIKDFEGRDQNVIWSMGMGTKSDDKQEISLKEVNVNNGNPFLKLETNEEQEAGIRVPGSPIYYKDYNSGTYVIGIISGQNEIFLMKLL